jgi:hypothetical protein
LLARNFDFDGGRFFDEDKAVVVVKREGTIPFVHVAIVGLSGAVSGINQAGIAVAVLAGASDASIHPRAPMIFILREILEQARSLDDVHRILETRRGFVSEGILAVDGTHGEGAIFEVTPEDVDRLPVGEAGALSNHFRGARAGDEANRLRMEEGTSVARLARMQELVAAGPLDTRRAAAILRDRAAVGGAPLPGGHEAAINADIASHGVIIDATARTLLVSVYPNLSGVFVEFELDALLEGALEGELSIPVEAPELTWKVRRARELTSLAEGQPPASAVVTLRRAVALHHGDGDAMLALGEALLREGQPAEAAALARAVLATPPERAKQRREAEALLTASR